MLMMIAPTSFAPLSLPERIAKTDSQTPPLTPLLSPRIACVARPIMSSSTPPSSPLSERKLSIVIFEVTDEVDLGSARLSAKCDRLTQLKGMSHFTYADRNSAIPRSVPLSGDR